MAVALEGQAKGWASNLANRVTRGVTAERQLLQSPSLCRQLPRVNAMRARLLRKLVCNYLGRKRLLDPLQLPMQVNQLSAGMAPKTRSDDVFLCHACGHRAHADVNAAKSQCRRSALSATPRPGSRHGWRVQSLQQWAARLRASLAKQDISGLLQQHRAVGCARAGLRALAQRKNLARGLSSGIRQELLQAALAPTTEGLLKGLAWVVVQYV